MHGARTSVPEGDPAMERRGPGGVTASWLKGGQNKVTLQPQPGAFVQVHYKLGLKSITIFSIRLTVKKNYKQLSFLAPIIFPEQAQNTISQNLII